MNFVGHCDLSMNIRFHAMFTLNVCIFKFLLIFVLFGSLDRTRTISECINTRHGACRGVSVQLISWPICGSYEYFGGMGMGYLFVPAG